ncbi:MAG: alpha-amylase [Oscillospiraceae bacterium]|jgi:glycosidase|nr:alpha-amylase [Oscillospiraceae bacterium]
MHHNDLSVYHIYSLSLTNQPFINDYQTVTNSCEEIVKWIPHIKEMGFNAVLFSPVLKSRSHGYDVTDYYNIDNRLGTNENFKYLVENFHKNDIKVILDCVFNHCGRDFPIFQELKNGDRSKAEWFMGVDFNRQSPMGDYFDYSTWSGYYELVKFNLANPKVKEYLLNAAKFWVTELGADGFRLDSANVMDFDFMMALRYEMTQLKPDFWLMGEVVSGDYNRWVNNDVLHSVTGYMVYKALFSSHNSNNLYELENTISRAVPSQGLPLYNFLDNHDQPRIASNVERREYLYTLYTLLFTIPGIPSVYYGSEWEMKGVKNNGSDAPLRPYIDIENSPKATDITALIRKLNQIRANYAPLRYGNYKLLFLKYHEPFAFERAYNGEKVIVAINNQDRDFTISLGNENCTDVLTNQKMNTSNIQIPAFSSRILVFGEIVNPDKIIIRSEIVSPPVINVSEDGIVTVMEIKKEIEVVHEKSQGNIQRTKRLDELETNLIKKEKQIAEREKKLQQREDKLNSVINQLQTILEDLKN